ncbi:IclR family transcriptional regulator [Jannaschia pagri]|uniref:IclR family transcriptional regulator n=1 Tax=Jannaschia pagri TaxID=2829797 RepID=A0ABQ4NLZ3_9RHOB|nr:MULTISPECIES: IclR family transcriptional regulator [unclassified Jannaschia]GIT91605.1 IclR family transcriptional regulator [Jannaschia sp. AI_61]GIT95439.1 IclR family transcriptional regulator [Jannaschia sp. AI_62]
MDGHRSDSIPTNLRLLMVLEEVARAGVPITPTEVNARLGLPKPTIHRLFSTLLDEGFLQRDIGGRAYLPGARLRRLAGGVLSSAQIQTARKSILTQLSHSIGETCNIALPEGDRMVYLERVETEWPLRIQLPPGTRVPMYCTASGKMFLSTLSPRTLETYLDTTELEAQTPDTYTDRASLESALATIRRRGHSEDRGEFMPDMVAVAVPILDPNNRLLATLSVHAPTQRMDLDGARACLPRLKEAAQQLAALVTD